ncbi:MAG TPA: hypothetical protein VKV32_13035 [Stellaceae bacterium]|nr:hypothetical protein [Stellaceae bacterium]
MNSFKRRFWLASVVMTALLLIPFFVWSRIEASRLPPKPAFPLPGHAFVAEYGGQASYVAHLLYWWGLFGFGERIRSADVVMLGSSHMQFGLSARQLSATLSAAAGRPLRVFNAGLGCDTPLGFDAALLDRQGVRDRAIIADTFAYDYDPYNAECFSELDDITDRVHAVFEALAVWTRFAADWALDGILPRVDLSQRRPVLGRYLNAPALILDWNYGDVVYAFSPNRGEVYPAPLASTPQDVAKAQPAGESLTSGTIPMPNALANVVARRDLRPIFTLIPFVTTPAFDRERFTHVAQLLAAAGTAPRAPLIAIAPAGFESFDGEHLTGPSRDQATRRLGDALAAAEMLQAAPQDGTRGR